MKLVKLLVGVGLLSTACFSTRAQSLVSDRTALNVLLGTYRVDEGFENGPISGDAAIGGDGLLSSTNNWSGAGLNLVVPGITFEADQSIYSIRWSGDGFRGLATRAISGGLSLRLDFWNSTTAFGLDLEDYAGFRTVDAAGITVYGADDTTVLYSGSWSISNPNGTFFGYEYSGGIGSVLFTVATPGANYEGNSPVIDNLSFSSVPEPTTLSLAVIGAATLFFIRRRR